MFTGIIEEIGTVLAIRKNNNSAYIKIHANVVLEDTKIGDSISVSGACQTVIVKDKDFFEIFTSSETLKLTTLGDLKPGDKVNLERAMKLSSRLGGHIVSGHVDTKVTLISKKNIGEANELVFKAPAEQLRQVVKKGSVTIDGISLTVADTFDDKFSVAVIPHTFENTTLGYLHEGDFANLETDLLSKYIEKYLLSDHNKSAISMDFLKENGFF